VRGWTRKGKEGCGEEESETQSHGSGEEKKGCEERLRLSLVVVERAGKRGMG
jgi:hypothetical protein